MPPDVTAPDLTLGIAGSGAMGCGIAQIAAQAGVRVLLYDGLPDVAVQARGRLADSFDLLARKGSITPAQAADALSRLQPVAQLSDLSACGILIEAIVENLDAKRRLFSAIENVVAADTILATNTSSLSVTALAAACRLPGRVAGFHFFNPVPRRKVVEVIDGLLTESWAIEALMGLARRVGHAPVRCRDTPGFIVNHAGRGLVTEALRVLQEGIAPFHDIDRILREAAGFPLGPFELLDLTGLDVSQPVMESIYHQFYQEPRFRPSPLTAQRLAADVLGRKSGTGFYRYTENRREEIPEPPPPRPRPVRVWVGSADPGLRAQVITLVKQLGGSIDANRRPATDSLCVVTPRGLDATSCCATESLDATRTVALDLLLGSNRRRTLMTTPLTSPAMREAAHGLFAADGVPVTVIRDSPGFIVQRVLAQIVNIGCDIAQQRIAAPQDIDRAVMLGLGYPQGPLAWGDALGPRIVLNVLESLQQFYGDPRYRPSPWLKRRALLGVSLLTPES